MSLSLKDRVAKSVFWIVWSRAGIQVISGISSIVVARLWLEPSDYGLIAIAGVWTTTMGMMTEMGLGTAIVQFRDMVEKELNMCFWLIVTIGIGGYASLFATAPFIAQWFGTPMLTDILRVAGLALPLTSLAVVPDSLLRKRLELDKLAKIHVVGALVSVVTVVTTAANGAGVWALVWAALMGLLVVNVGLYWTERWTPGFGLERTRLLAILQFSMSTLGSRFFWTVYNQVDVVALGKLTGEATLGFYSYAKELAMLPVVRGSAVVNQFAFPVMAELQDDPDAMRAAFVRGLRIVSCCFFPVCVGMALVAQDAVLVLLTEKWLLIVPMLQLLCIYGSIKSIDVMLPPVLLARYRHGFLLHYTIVLFLVMSTAFWFGAMWNGGMGVVLVWVVVYPILMMGLVREVLKEISMSLKTFLQQMRTALNATLVMVIAVMIIQEYVLPSDSTGSLFRLILTSVTGALVYGSTLFAQGGKSVDEVREVLRWIFLPKHAPSGNIQS